MLGFWIIAGAAALITVAILGRALITGGDTGQTDSTAAHDVQVYRDQLAELDRDVARGVIGEAEAERARVETSRRLLEADRRARGESTTGTTPRGLTLGALAVAGLVIVGGGLGLYTVAGAPGTPDLPLATRIANAETARADRPNQAALEADLPHWAGPPPEAGADYIEMVERLRAATEGRPPDLEGQTLLAQHEAALGNFSAAHKAMAQVIELKGAEVAADDYTQYADLLVLAAHGRVSPEAETAIRLALEIDPNDGIALYYLGLMYGQNERPDRAFPIWRDLLERSRAGDPWVEPIRGQIGQLAAMAGVDYTPPALAAAGPAGPSAEDMEALAQMSPEDRAEVIRGMVDQLMQRLATEGGTPQEWAQLIGALAIIGDTERARAIWGEARSVFAETPEVVAAIDETAESAGLSDPIGFDGTDAPGPADAPAGGPGPDADDIAAAAEMSPEDRAAMVAGMVDGLEDELLAEGGPPQKWIMLLNSLGQLGETARAASAWEQAQAYFAEDAAGLAQVRAAAAALGLVE